MNRHLVTHGKLYDAVHIHSIKLAWSVLFAKQLGLKVIFHLHELPRTISPLLRRAMAAADCTVFCSETCAAHFAGINVQRSQTIVNALQFREVPAIQHTDSGKRIVMAASLNRNKGQDLLLAAFSKLHHADAELWLYGTIGLSAHGYVRQLKQLVRQCGIDSRVFFPGPTTEVFSVFARSAVLAHTSWTESFGMALVEAQSAGIPVVAHDLEGMREVVEDGITGFLIRPGDTAQLAARLDELLDSAELRNRMGSAGYRMTRDRFDISNRITAYRQLYSEVCAS